MQGKIKRGGGENIQGIRNLDHYFLICGMWWASQKYIKITLVMEKNAKNKWSDGKGKSI